MITKNSITILGLISMILLISGCIWADSNNDDSFPSIKPGYGVVGNSEFVLESGWYQRSVSKQDTSASFIFNGTSDGNVISMRAYQFTNNKDYDEKYNHYNQPTDIYRVISTNIENIENVNVKTIRLSRLDDTETIKHYFFEKNGKYYHIFIDIGGYKGASKSFDNKKQLIERTINSVVSTIN